MDKLGKFINSISHANGPAQIVGYAFWGALMAGMLWDFSPSDLPRYLLLTWAIVSSLVLFTCIWFSKNATKKLLWVDMVISAIVLSIVSLHDPEVMRVMYTVQSDGHFIKNYVSDYFTIAGLAWMTIHGAYLADLISRQELESKRLNT